MSTDVATSDEYFASNASVKPLSHSAEIRRTTTDVDFLTAATCFPLCFFLLRTFGDELERIKPVFRGKPGEKLPVNRSAAGETLRKLCNTKPDEPFWHRKVESTDGF